jgi:ABC-2 type transport system permease protein
MRRSDPEAAKPVSNRRSIRSIGKVLIVARREYLAAVRTKGFIIGLVLAPLLMSGGVIGLAIFKDQVDTTDQRLAIVDRSGLIAPALVQAAEVRNAKEVTNPKTGKKIRPAYLTEVLTPNDAHPEAQRLELSDRVRNKSLYAFVEIGDDILHPKATDSEARVHYFAKNGALDDLRRWVATPINDELRRRRLLGAGVDVTRVTNLFDWVQVESLSLVARDARTGAVTKAERRGEAEAVLLPMVSQILMFMLLMMGATPLLQTIMEEKTHRIAEVMLASITPFQLMMGKLLGGVAVSLTGSAVYLLGAVGTLTSMALTTFIPYQVLPWFFVYLVAAIFLFGAMFAAIGSACSDPKDAQSLQLPAMLPLIFPMFLLGPLLKEPHSTMAVVLSLVPPFTPTLMLLRLSTPAGVPAWQPWVGLVGVIACGAFSVWAGGRIFRVGILMQGKPPKFADLLRWAVRG